MQGVIPKFSGVSGKKIEPAPSVGQHNEEIYLGFLGLSRDELGSLKKEGVI